MRQRWWKFLIRLRMENIDKVAKCWNFCMLNITFWCQQHHIIIVSWKRISSMGEHSSGALWWTEFLWGKEDLRRIFSVSFFCCSFLSQRSWKQSSARNTQTYQPAQNGHETTGYQLSQNYICSVNFSACGSCRVKWTATIFLCVTKARVITGWGVGGGRDRPSVFHLTSGTSGFICYLNSIKFT